MTQSPEEKLLPCPKVALIDAILRAYHTTRLSDTPVATHILSKYQVQEAFDRLATRSPSPSGWNDGVEALEVLVSEFSGSLEMLDRNGPDLTCTDGEFVSASTLLDRREVIDRAAKVLRSLTRSPLPCGRDEVERAAVALLARHYREFGCDDNADGIEEDGPHGPEEEAAVAAVRAALSAMSAAVPEEGKSRPYKRALYIEFDGKEPVRAVYKEDGREVMDCAIRDPATPSSASLPEEVEGLVERAQRFAKEQSGPGGHHQAAIKVAALAAALSSYASREERLRKALEPFAEALREWGDDPAHPDFRDIWEHPVAMCIKLGDFRRARDELAALNKKD